MSETTAQQLRRVISEIRRKFYPISDLIPLLDRAASELEQNEKKEMEQFQSDPNLWTV